LTYFEGPSPFVIQLGGWSHCWDVFSFHPNFTYWFICSRGGPFVFSFSLCFALRPHNDNIELTAPDKFMHTKKLSSLFQVDLYKGILMKRAVSDRQITAIHLDITRWAIKDLSGKLPAEDKIWKSIRHEDITSPIKDFLWESLHGIHREESSGTTSQATDTAECLTCVIVCC
jgi:hypothetical protein